MTLKKSYDVLWDVFFLIINSATDIYVNFPWIANPAREKMH